MEEDNLRNRNIGTENVEDLVTLQVEDSECGVTV